MNPANQHAYYLLTSSSWVTSEAQAVALGGHLATINDAAENQWVLSTFGYPSGNDRALWIGLNDAAVEGTMVWADGTALGYTNWYNGSQTGNGPSSDYAYMMPQQAPNLTQGGQWYFTPAFITYGVVEVVPEPSGAAFALVCLAGLLRRRRC